ncbi:MAG: radical SAM protein [Candidatus Micrarchaeota archaeon]
MDLLQAENKRKIAVWTCTNACNLNCKFCFGKEKRLELNTEHAKKLIKKISARKIKYFVFSGGEPLLRRDIFILADFVRKLGMKVFLHTNGVLIDENNISNIIKHFDLINLPIDGANETTNYAIGRGSLKHTLKVLDLLATKRNVRITTVATKTNLNEIKKIAALLKNRPIKQWRIFQFDPKLGEARANKKIFEITPSEFEKLKKSLSAHEKINAEFIPMNSDFDKTYWMISSDGKIIR